LLRVGGRSYLLSPGLGQKLARFEGCYDSEQAARFLTAEEIIAVNVLLSDRADLRRKSSWNKNLSASRWTAGRRVIWPRLPLIPGTLVGILARRLRSLATAPMLTVATVTGLVAYGAAGLLMEPYLGWQETSITTATPTEFALAVFLFLVSALWHELGHAAALACQGYPPGPIGVGLLLFIPVLFCDVTAAAALPRFGRLRVDGAGIAWQLALGGTFFLTGSWLGEVALRVAGLSALIAILWSLLPFLRTDGYWFLCDLLGRRDLESPLEEKLRPSVNKFHSAARWRLLALLLIFYRFGHVLFLLLVSLWLPWRLAQWILATEILAHGSPPVRDSVYAIIGVVAALLVWMWFSVLVRIRRLLAANRNDWRVIFS